MRCLYFCFAATLLGTLSFCCGCRAAHPYRISQRQLKKLVRGQPNFVLVFGSVTTLQGGRDVTREGARVGAGIRFVHKDPSSEDTLADVSISSGERFYAVLLPPAGAEYIDHFDAEVRWGDPAYDKVTYIRLREKGPFAMYIGEIRLSVSEASAPGRTSPKQTLSVMVRDDFERATSELRRLYPRFTGQVRKSPLLRASGPPVPKSDSGKSPLTP